MRIFTHTSLAKKKRGLSLHYTSLRPIKTSFDLLLFFSPFFLCLFRKYKKPLHSVSEYHVSVRKATVSQKWLSYLSKTYLKYKQKWTIRSHLCSTHCVWQFLSQLFPFIPYFFRLSGLWNWSPMCSLLRCGTVIILFL